jgi:hypothetical protein
MSVTTLVTSGEDPHRTCHGQVRVVLCLHPLWVSRTANQRLLSGPT